MGNMHTFTWACTVGLTLRCVHGGDSKTAVHPIAAEGGPRWNFVDIDCDSRDGPITIVRATYGVPCEPGCKTCGNIPLGNLDIDAGRECDGKQKCVVSSCPCTAGNVPPAGATCDKHWVDPALRCKKGLTVTYRCGDAACRAAAWRGNNLTRIRSTSDREEQSVAALVLPARVLSAEVDIGLCQIRK